MIALTNLQVIGLLICTSYACRAAGFLLMRYVPFTAPVRRGLEALPGSVIAAVMLPGAIDAGIPGLAGASAGILGMAIFKHDIAAIVLGCGAAALARVSGF